MARKQPPLELAIDYAMRLSRYTVPIVLTLVALYVFGEVAEAMIENEDIATWDRPLTDYLVENRTGVGINMAELFSFLGGTNFLLPASIVVTIVLWWARKIREAVIFVAAMLLTSASVVALKLAFGRDRPEENLVYGLVNDAYAFPSGHTTHTAVFYGLIIAMTLSWWGRHNGGIALRGFVLGVALWAFMVFSVAWSRMYLAYHWFTDVVGGAFLGIAVLAFARIAWQKALHGDKPKQRPRVQ